MSNNQTTLCRYKISLTAEDDMSTTFSIAHAAAAPVASSVVRVLNLVVVLVVIGVVTDTP